MKFHHSVGDPLALLLVSVRQLWICASFALFAAVVSYPWWEHVSFWAGAALAFSVFTILHLSFVCRQVVPLPHIAILICTLQLGLAPWLSSYFPASSVQYSISDIPQYLSYAGPVLLAISLGWVLSSIGFHPAVRRESAVTVDPPLLQSLDWLFWGGLGMAYLETFFAFGSLGFLIALLANLRFIGAIGAMLLSARGWRWRIMVVVALELSRSVEGAMFHSLILWLLCILAAYLFIRRPSIALTWLWLSLLGLGSFVLHDAKFQIREAVWGGSDRVTVFGKDMEISSWNRPIVGSLCFVQSTLTVLSGEFSEESSCDMVMRYNEGWIIDRVLHHVPAEEPYARGETVLSAFKAALLPRVVAPNKQMAGGKFLMQRFADYLPFEDTSMNIGFAGEMYANFGYWGGIVGCGIYALVLGLLFRWVAIRARASPLWWAVAVYVGHWAFKAESDIGSVLNFTVKAALVAFVVVLCLPPLRAELAGRSLAARKLPRHVRERKATPVRVSGVPTPDL